VSTRVPDLVAKLLGHKVARALHLAPTDGTGAATQARPAFAAKTVSVEALQDGGSQQLVTHWTLQHVPEALPEFCRAVSRQLTTARPLVLPEEFCPARALMLKHSYDYKKQQRIVGFITRNSFDEVMFLHMRCGGMKVSD
jgi:hypothetical protein